VRIGSTASGPDAEGAHVGAEVDDDVIGPDVVKVVFADDVDGILRKVTPSEVMRKGIFPACSRYIVPENGFDSPYIGGSPPDLSARLLSRPPHSPDPRHPRAPNHLILLIFFVLLSAPNST